MQQYEQSTCQSKDKGECSVTERKGVCCTTAKLYKQTPGDPQKEVYRGNVTNKTE